VVARDGIEPPTPAFSGPRSTTELPGLSADFVANSCAGSIREDREGRAFREQCAATTLPVYQLLWAAPNVPTTSQRFPRGARQCPQNRVNFPFRAGPETLHWKAIMRRPVFRQACFAMAAVAAVFCLHSRSFVEAQSTPAPAAAAASTHMPA